MDAHRALYSLFHRLLFPEVGIATLELLERLGHEVVYPRDQTCCGQPMADNGFNAEAADPEALFVHNFSGFDHIVVLLLQLLLLVGSLVLGLTAGQRVDGNEAIAIVAGMLGDDA